MNSSLDLELVFALEKVILRSEMLAIVWHLFIPVRIPDMFSNQSVNVGTFLVYQLFNNKAHDIKIFCDGYFLYLQRNQPFSDDLVE